MDSWETKVIVTKGKNRVAVWWMWERLFYFIFLPHHVACGTLVPHPGIKPATPALEARSPNHWTTREVLRESLLILRFFSVYACITYYYRSWCYTFACVYYTVAQLCLALCDPIDCNPPGFYVHVILQARILEWIAIPFSRRFPTLGSNPGLLHTYLHQFSQSVQLLSCVWLSVTPWIAAHQASLSITNSRSSLKLMPIKSVMPSSHLILCCPLLLLPPIPPSIRVFSNESTLCMRWPKYWSFSFSISPNEHPGLISFRMGWLDLLVVQGTLKSLL